MAVEKSRKRSGLIHILKTASVFSAAERDEKFQTRNVKAYHVNRRYTIGVPLFCQKRYIKGVEPWGEASPNELFLSTPKF